VVKRACRRAAAILTVSEFSKKQIVDWSRISPEKIFNVWSGVDSIYQIEGDSYGLPFPYILSVSNRKPHKNGLRIVEAFAKASLNPQIHLVFTGKPCAQFLHCIEAQQLHSRVDFLGFVPEAKMPSLYRGAEALIFPSLSEGFGLPILEAMACGIPVVTSNAAAMPEVAGDAALLVDPTSVEEIAAAMERIVSDTALRQMLQEKGLNRAKDFPWTKTSSEVHKVIGIIR
jgi:glycosyltransferase involved in cell wall biosynthesis